MFNFLNQRTAAPQIDMNDIIAQVADGSMILIDVRDGNELAQTGKAEGAIHLPLMSFQMKVDPRSPEVMAKLDVSKPVGIYCATGARSNMAMQAMKQMGYETVHNLGGLGNWANAGGKITRA